MSDGKKFLGYTPEQYKKFKRNAWVVLLAFSVLYCFLYCGRQNLSYAAKPDFLVPDVSYVPEIIFGQIEPRLRRGEKPGQGLIETI